MPRPIMPYVQKEKTRHGRAVYYFRASKDSKRTRLPDAYGSAEFFQAYVFARAGIETASPQRLKADFRRPAVSFRREVAVRAALKRAVEGAAGRARERNFNFDISLDWAMTEVMRQKFHCALTRIPFYFGTEKQTKRNPYAPSIDRIDSKLGYTRDNVRIVVYAVNVMLWEWGEDVFAHVAECYKANKQRTICPHHTMNSTS